MMTFGINVNAMLVRIGHLHVIYMAGIFNFLNFVFRHIYAMLGLIHDLPV